MAQNDFGTIDPNTKSGTALASDLNDWRDTVHSSHAGATVPSYAVAGMIWADDSSDLVYYAHDGTDDIPVFALDETNNWARFILDADEDSYLEATADDAVELVLGGSQLLAMSASLIESTAAIQTTGGSPAFVIEDTDLTSTFRQIRLQTVGTTFEVRGATDGGVGAGQPFWRVGLSASGATTQEFWIGSDEIMSLGTTGITIDGDDLYLNIRPDGATGAETGVRLLTEAGVLQTSLLRNTDGSVALIGYSGLGNELHRLDIQGDADGAFFEFQGADDKLSFRFPTGSSVRAGRTFQITEDALAGFDTDTAGTQYLNIPTTSAGGSFGSAAIRDLTTANAANVNVDTTTGIVRRSTSSGRYKEDRQGIASPLSLIARLNPVSFRSTHKEDADRRLAGFIAEEVAEVFPEAQVDDGENYDVRAIVAALVAAVQELSAQQRVTV